MSESHPTAPAPTAKPAKPSPDFQLFPHAAGVWAKKIRGKMYYFGPWDDPQGALKRYDEQKEALHAGRKARPDPEAVTVKDVANAWLNHKLALVDAGELSPLSMKKYQAAVAELLAHVGKSRLAADLGPDDFAGLRERMAAKWGPLRLGDCIQHVRSALKHAYEAGLIPVPTRFGPAFKGPSKKALRLHRAAQGPKLFSAEEVRALANGALVVGAAGPELVWPGSALRAMILLGINCGFGNGDCNNLPLAAVNLDAGWIDYPRPKTGIARRCPLWPETVAALRAALAARPEPRAPEYAGLVFLTRCGRGWDSDFAGGTVSRETAKLLRRFCINGRKGLGFYTLRHTFRTVADEARDQPAADFIMGHEVPHMSSVYRETISVSRLKAVADHVRAWLFGPVGKAEVANAAEPRHN
jgi:integrase